MSEKSGADALEGWETVAKSASGPALVGVIKSVLKDPHIFVFGELLALQNVQELEKNPDTRPWLEVLRIFAYGTYKDYKTKREELKLPELPEPQIEKLKQLTLATHASNTKTLAYTSLIEELDLKDQRELEDLIIDTNYIGLIKGKLDQKKSTFEVEYAIGRDIGPKDVGEMVEKIASWMSASQELLSVIDKNIAQAARTMEQKRKEDEETEKQRSSMVEIIKMQREQQQPEQLANMMGGFPGPLGFAMGLAGFDGMRRGPGGPMGRRQGGGGRHF